MGRQGYANTVEHQIGLTEYLAQRLDALPYFSRIGEVETAVCCFRFLPEATKQMSDLEIDRLQQHLQQVIERSGEAWLTTTVLHGRRALRVNVNSFLTEQRHIDDLLELLVRSRQNCSGGTPWPLGLQMRRLKISLILLTLLSVTSYAQNGPLSLPSIKSQAEFDSISVTYDANTPYALPHALFVIDRKDNNKIYYVNNKRYSFHKDFVNGTYLSLESGKEFFDNNYLKPNRRFILGTVAYQTPVKRWSYEFWEGDLIPADQIQLAGEVINKTFFTPVAFKPNSLRQDDASHSLAGVERVLQSDIAKNRPTRR